jgi:hypothetical protein
MGLSLSDDRPGRKKRTQTEGPVPGAIAKSYEILTPCLYLPDARGGDSGGSRRASGRGLFRTAVGMKRTRELLMRIAAMVVVALSLAFYFFVLVQFRREQRRSKRNSGSLTFLGSSEEQSDSLPPKRDDRSRLEPNSPRKQKLVSISQRAVIKSVATPSQKKANSDRLPYFEITLPITAVVTPVRTARDEPHSNLPRRRRA